MRTKWRIGSLRFFAFGNLAKPKRKDGPKIIGKLASSEEETDGF